MRGSWLVSLLLAACLGLSGTVGATTLAIAQMPGHQHVASGYSPTSQAWDLRPGGILAFWDKAETPRSVTTSSAGASKTHTHSLAASTGPANNLPPYYSLAYIMRVA